MYKKIKNTALFLKNKFSLKPKVGIVLGTGLGDMINIINIEQVIEYKDIPDFPVSTVESHHGKLIFGTVNNIQIVAMQGRFHYYEGYTPQQITFPIRVMKLLGIEYLFLSNACGGLNPDYEIGDLMIINDHINLIPNPLIGPNIDELGPRFPDMSDSYNKNLINKALKIAHENNIKVQQGCYVSVTGPTLETPKEYRYYRIIGGDVVGMSTTPEVIVARHMNIPCFAISIVTDLGVPGKIVKVTIEDVKKVAAQAEPKMTLLMQKLIFDLK